MKHSWIIRVPQTLAESFSAIRHWWDLHPPPRKHTYRPGGLIYIVAIPVSLQSLLPLLAQPCLDPGCQLQSSSPHSCLVQSDSQDMCSEFSALGFPFPFQLWIDFLQCLHIACIWLLLADFGGDIGQVSFHWKATKRQLESIQQRVNSLFLMSEESWG